MDKEKIETIRDGRIMEAQLSALLEQENDWIAALAGFSTLATINRYSDKRKYPFTIGVFRFFILSNFLFLNVVWRCILCYNPSGGIPYETLL